MFRPEEEPRNAPQSVVSNEVAVLRLDGDLDLFRADEAGLAIRREEARRPAVLVLDLRGATFLDSSMLRVIVAAHNRARSRGHRLVVATRSEVVRRLFRITLLEWRLEIVDDPADVDDARDRAADARARRGR